MSDNPFESPEEKLEDSTPKAVEKSKPQLVVENPFEDDIVPDVLAQDTEDESTDFEVEEDGDVFWIIQKFAWIFLRVLFWVGMIGFVLWIIWKPGIKNSPEKKAISEIVKQQEKEIPKEKKEVENKREGLDSPIFTERSDILFLSEWNHWLEQNRQLVEQNIIDESISWIEGSSSLFSIPLKNQLHAPNKEKRSQNVETMLQTFDQLLRDSGRIRQSLNTQIGETNGKLSVVENEFNQLQEPLQIAFQGYDSVAIQSIVLQRKELKQEIVSYQSDMGIRTDLLRSMEQYDRVIRQADQDIKANRLAIIEDIRVVAFPGNHLDRILTPAQWQATQNTQRVE